MSEVPETNIADLTQSDLFHKVSDICATVNVVANSRDLLEISLKKTMDLFGAQRGSIFILKDNGKDLILKIARGLDIDEEKDLVKKLGEGVVGRVAATKKPVFVNDIGSDNRFEDYKPRKSYKTPSFICVPLIIKDQLIGVFNLADKDSGKRFSQNELQLLDFLGSQIALNFRRIQLYQKFKTIVRESRNLKDELGKSSKETTQLKNQIVIHEKLATLGKLAGGIAHEFNNPLDGVMRYTNLCLEQTTEEGALRGYLLEIKSGLNRMANIVRNLLACSRSATPTNQRINPNQIIASTIKEIQTSIINKNITINSTLADEIPEISDLGIELIMVNLLRNAVDSIEQDGEVNVASKLSGNNVEIKIQDTGCGVSKEELEKIFEPFFTTKDIDKGCGLGLTIVSEIVKSYTGQINVESEKGKGTTFTIRIPTKNG